MDKSRTEQAAGGGDISAALDPMQLRVALTDLMNPAGVAAEAPRLAAELIMIALGITAVELPEQDARFADPAWRDNPLYRLIGQSYLAWEQSVSRLVEHFTGDWQRRERARYWADIITGGLAPTNFLPGNPAALKRAFETGGLSVARGYRNFLRDLLANSGMPQMVDTRPFTVGENLAVSPGAVVYREEMFELLQYTPTTKKVRERPLLFVPPELNRHTCSTWPPAGAWSSTPSPLGCTRSYWFGGTRAWTRTRATGTGGWTTTSPRTYAPSSWSARSPAPRTSTSSACVPGD